MAKPEGLRGIFNKQPWWLRTSEVALVGGLVLSACGGSDKHDTSSSAPIVLPKDTDAPMPKVTFDDRGGGSPKIQVYPGPMDTPEDRMALPRPYEDGEKARAYCVTEAGRAVYPHPEAGEKPATHEEADHPSVWVKIVDTEEPPLPNGTAVTAWAPGIYLHNPLPNLPDCAG